MQNSYLAVGLFKVKAVKKKEQELTTPILHHDLNLNTEFLFLFLIGSNEQVTLTKVKYHVRRWVCLLIVYVLDNSGNYFNHQIKTLTLVVILYKK